MSSIYQVPQAFQDRLEQEFGGRLRVRWSDQFDEWQLEQKIRRGRVGRPTVAQRFKDDTIRYVDGYAWVMSFKQGTRFACPTCGVDLKAPTRETAMVSCWNCKAKGRSHYWLAAHWPFDETLIDHIKKMEREVDDRFKLLRESEEKLRRQQWKQATEGTLAGFEDNFDLLAGIPKVGYTGKERMWDAEG